MLGNPLNTHNFQCIIPALEDVQIMVASTTFPSERLQEYVMFFQGERVKFPSIPTNDGVWNCTMPEGEFAKIMTALQREMDLNYNQDTGRLTHWSIRDKFDIEVYARGLRGDVSGSDKVFGVKLIGCFLQSRDNVNLDNSQPTANWVWNVSFSYDAIKNLEISPLGAVERG